MSHYSSPNARYCCMFARIRSNQFTRHLVPHMLTNWPDMTECDCGCHQEGN